MTAAGAATSVCGLVIRQRLAVEKYANGDRGSRIFCCVV